MVICYQFMVRATTLHSERVAQAAAVPELRLVGCYGDPLLPHSRGRSTSYWQSYCAQRVRDGEIHPAKTARCKSSSRGDGLDDEAVSLHS